MNKVLPVDDRYIIQMDDVIMVVNTVDLSISRVNDSTFKVITNKVPSMFKVGDQVMVGDSIVKIVEIKENLIKFNTKVTGKHVSVAELVAFRLNTSFSDCRVVSMDQNFEYNISAQNGYIDVTITPSVSVRSLRNMLIE